MHLLTHLRAKIALLFAGALLWSAPAWAETYVLSYWDFNALAQSLGTTTLTSSGAYQVVGQTNPEWTDKSVTTTQFGDTLAFTQLYGTASKGFYLRDRRSYNAAQCGLYSLTENHTLTIRQLKKDYVVTLTGQSSVIKEAYTGNYGGAWTATANADSTEYVYTMTADGDLNLLCSAWVYLYTLKIEGPIPDVYTPTLEVIEGTDNTSKLLQFNCRTQSAQILYTITYADGTTESGHCQPGGQVCISKTASSITAQAVVNEGTTEEQTSDPLVKSNIIAGQVAAPTVTVTAVYYGERTVSFACTTEGATVFYRTADDGEYTTDSTVVISDTTTFSVFATLPDVYTDALFVSDTVSVKVGAGTSIRLVGVTYAAVGDSITMTANQSSVLCKPSATISYTYTPFDEVTGLYGPDQSGSIRSGEKVVLGYGDIMARATAEGYLNSALRIVEYLPLEMKEVEGRSWDFTQYRGQTITEGASMTVSRVPCYQLVVGGTAVEDIYLQDATSWLARANGLYNRSAGNRFVVIDHVKAGQYVTVTGVQSYGSLNYQTVVNGTQKVMNSTPTTLIFQVNEDGTFAFNPSRYLYIQSIVISDDLSTSRTITYDEVSGYTTFYWNKAIAIPDSVTAYTAQLNEAQDALTLHEITSGYIPACMPVVLYAEGKRGQSDVVTEATDIPSDTLYSDLRGILIAQNTSEYVTDGQVYVLSRQEEASTIGFYKYTGETLAANKAYLVVPASKGNAPIVRFDFGQGAADNVTGIENLNAADAYTAAPARIFDLQGRALRQAPQHGIYLLNGRKVIR